MNGTIELILFIIFVACLLLLFRRTEKRQRSLFPLVDALSVQRMRLTMRECGFESSLSHSDEENYVFHVMRESYFQGRSMREACELLAQQILKSEEHRLGKRRFLLLCILRIFVVLGLSIFARVYIHNYFEIEPQGLMDRISLLGALFFAFIFFAAMSMHYPKSWFLNDRMGKEGKNWILALFMGQVCPSSPIYELWKKMEDRERSSGISLASTKQDLLGIWRSKKEIEWQETLRIFEDYVPAAEFICLGCSSLLILAAPICQILSF